MKIPLVNLLLLPQSLDVKKTTVENSTADCENALLEALTGTRNGDTNFALSIVPSFQALTPEDKLDGKINILNIFKEILAERHCQTTFEQPTTSENILQSTSFSLPTHHRGTCFPTHPVTIQTKDYSFGNDSSPNLTPSQGIREIQNITLPGCSNDTVQSYLTNFSDNS